MKLPTLLFPALLGYSALSPAAQFTIAGDLQPPGSPQLDAVFPGATVADLNRASGLAGASGDGGYDTFDGYGYYVGSNAGVTNGLSHTRQAIAQTGNIYQWLDTFTNTASGAVSRSVTFSGNLGSDYSTRTERGDQNFLITSDGNARYDPVVAHVLGNNAFAHDHMTRQLSGDSYRVAIDLALAPGESVSVLMYAFAARDMAGGYTQSARDADIALAITTAESLVSNPLGFGLSDAQIASIVNFDGVTAAAALPVPSVTNVPLPAAAWMFMASVLALGAQRRASTHPATGQATFQVA